MEGGIFRGSFIVQEAEIKVIGEELKDDTWKWSVGTIDARKYSLS